LLVVTSVEEWAGPVLQGCTGYPHHPPSQTE
jgi:hypothetical protein